ncbi:MAG TPA: hypothetical protein PK733_16410 [Clostridiales bacterium]|nr:hypothetical protein [Clostridiales bacterium]
MVYIEPELIEWVKYEGALIPDVPPHIEVKMSNEYARYLFKTYKPYFIRWVSDFDCSHETEWWYVIKEKEINNNELEYSKYFRRYLKCGLKTCVVKKIDAEYIAYNGYKVYKNAFKRYDTFEKPIDEKDYMRHMLSFVNNSNYEFWGVFHKKSNALIAYSQNLLRNDCCEYSSMKFDPEFLDLRPSYPLIYETIKYYINDKKLIYVSFGARSIYHKTAIQEFLVTRCKFRKAYCRLNIIYSFKIKLIVNILYPFKNIISSINTGITNKIAALLQQEYVRRSFLN